VPSFNVTTASEKVHLDATGAGQAQYTVTNTSPDTLSGRLLGVAQDPAETAWLSIVGESTREFAPGAAEQVILQVRVPAGTPPATYSARLDAVSELQPDEDFTEGPTVSFEVSLPAPPVPWWKKYWWIWVIAGVVLVAIVGVVVWLLLRGNGSNPQQPTIQSVSFSGSSTNPTITVTGRGFTRSTPTGYDDSNNSCGTYTNNGDTYADAFSLGDNTNSWKAGAGAPPTADCIGLIVSSWTPNSIVFRFGSAYGSFDHWTVDQGDSYTLTVEGASYTGTANYG
jgi:hypothetical protein